MPGGDGTGPMGQGPMTGRAGGFCAGYEVPGYTNPIPGRGYGRGPGGGRGFGRGYGGGRGGGIGRGWRHRYYATGQPGWQRADWGWQAPPPGPPDPEAERHYLESEANALRAELESIQKRLEELASQPSGRD